MSLMNKLFSIELSESYGILRKCEPVKIGIPFPKGCIFSIDDLIAKFSDDTPCQVQLKPVSKWNDSSVKWLICDFYVNISPFMTERVDFFRQSEKKFDSNHIKITHRDNCLYVDTNTCIFCINKKEFNIFEKIIFDNINVIHNVKTCFNLIDSLNRKYNALIDDIVIEDHGPIRATIRIIGNLVCDGQKQNTSMIFVLRASFWNHKSNCKLEFTIRNSRPAHHYDGYWDLGDQSSFNIKLLSFSVGLRDSRHYFSEWKVCLADQFYKQYSNFCIYQDSSGGNNWKSKNHMDCKGTINRSFRGFKVIQENGKELCEGNRATPELVITDNNFFIAATVENFWQDFPSSLERKDNVINIAFFPDNTGEIFEIQGGEQKTFTSYLCFSQNDHMMSSNLAYYPIIPVITNQWYQKSNVFNFFTSQNDNDDIFITEIINESINGRNNFFSRREKIDEYGWRNFGDFFADHESYECSADFSIEPIISHYNNQYDVLQSLLMHFARTGQKDAFILAKDLARHIVDIDIYHTTGDRETNNNGLFWHTNHFLEANTATHRAFSRMQNIPKILRHQNIIGGGLCYEHAYTKGLLCFYYMTGDEYLREATLDLVSWVQNGFIVGNGLLSEVENVMKKCVKLIKRDTISRPFLFDGPGRASGNALSVLLDGYELTKNKQFIDLSELLIYQCVHPCENISKRDMLNPNTKQMYTIFLYSLSLYLEKKKEINEIDCHFNYARNVILHYARWIYDNEYLFLSKPEILDFPNHATRAAQDFRKANILLIASQYTHSIDEREILMKKGEFFYDSAVSFLKNLDTRMLARPIAIIMSTCHVKSFFNIHSFITMKIYSHKSTIKLQNIIIGKIINKFKIMTYFINNFSLNREVNWFLIRFDQIVRIIKNKIH